MLNFQAANFLALLQLCTPALTASLSPTPLSLSSIASPNQTLPFNLVEPFNSNSSAIPPGPWRYNYTPVKTVTFFNYRQVLNPVGISAVVRQAFLVAHSYDPPLSMGPQERLYTEKSSPDHVTLVFHPTISTAWGDWAATLEGITQFMVRWDNVGLNFEVKYTGDRATLLGTGRLHSTA